MKRLLIPGIVVLVWAIVTLGCNLPGYSGGRSTADLVNTAAAQTVRALGTLLSTSSAPTGSLMITQSITESSTVVSTQSESTQAFQESITPKTTPCDAASFLEDVSIADGTSMLPGTAFTKTWKIRNSGSCTWDDHYQVVFGNDGHAMSGVVSQPLKDTAVAPGDSVLISVKLVAPEKSGEYKGIWRLRNAEGDTFGKFWVSIVVESTPEGEYSFVYHLCSAEWKSGAGILACPGGESDDDGYVMRLDTPQFENGYNDDEPALLMAPQAINNGEITGKFLPISVPGGSHFQTVVGCVVNAEKCNVNMILKGQAAGESEKTLGEWNETYDGKITQVDISLDSVGLSNKSVIFTFIVRANGEAEQDRAFWLLPRIK